MGLDGRRRDRWQLISRRLSSHTYIWKAGLYTWPSQPFSALNAFVALLLYPHCVRLIARMNPHHHWKLMELSASIVSVLMMQPVADEPATLGKRC